MTDMTFEELGLRPELQKAIGEVGYESPSNIQAQAIPVALSGRDIVGLSQTGSGKTAAFVLPLLEKLDTQNRRAQSLILCPTRELAVQVCEEANRLGRFLDGFQAVPVYGGAPMDRQIRALKQGAQMVVGTPGRLLDHLRRGTFRTGDVQQVVLDEADRMLDMGFREEMEELLKAMPESRQTLFFSATMNRQVERLIKHFGKDPETIEIARKALTVQSIEQVSYEVRNRSKVEVLSRLLDLDNPRLTIVFCNTKRAVDETTEALLGRGYAVDRLHGDITQQLRERCLNRFRDGKIEILVATDVAARGIDIDEIDLVVNYDLPNDPEDYVHRIGRTGRAGRSGKAVSFVFGRDVYRLQQVERYIKQKIQRQRVPSQEVVEGKRADQLVETVKQRLEKGETTGHDHLIERLLEQGYTATDLCNALFTLLREATTREGEEIIEDNPDHQRKSQERRERRDRESGRGRDFRDQDEESGGRRKFNDRRERKPRENDSDGGKFKGPNPGWKRLFINIGRTDGTQPGEIAGMLYREADIPDGSLGRIQLFDRFTLVDVQDQYAKDVVNRVKQAKLRGRKLRIDYDRRSD